MYVPLSVYLCMFLIVGQTAGPIWNKLGKWMHLECLRQVKVKVKVTAP